MNMSRGERKKWLRNATFQSISENSSRINYSYHSRELPQKTSKPVIPHEFPR